MLMPSPQVYPEMVPVPGPMLSLMFNNVPYPVDNLQLPSDLKDQYWLWEESKGNSAAHIQLQPFPVPFYNLQSQAPLTSHSFQVEGESDRQSAATSAQKRERKKNKKLFTAKFIEQAEKILSILNNEPNKSKVIFSRSNKVSVPEGYDSVKERANFIGVSKNGKNWQSLIVIDNTKVYLGTYKTQLEAAFMFDFHSILVKFKKARVNNKYTVQEVINMINIFIAGGHEFDAEEYMRVRIY